MKKRFQIYVKNIIRFLFIYKIFFYGYKEEQGEEMIGKIGINKYNRQIIT